jgi:hypothetical protein
MQMENHRCQRNLQLSRDCCTHIREVTEMKSYTKINGDEAVLSIVLERHVLLYFQLCLFPSVQLLYKYTVH